MTRKCNDPYAMLRYSGVVLDDPDKGGFGKALEIVERARHLFPENLDVIYAYCILMFMEGHAEKVSKLEIDICMECGELAYLNKESELALRMFERTDINRYPYSAFLKTLIHMENRSKYATEISCDADELYRTISMDTWRTIDEKASAYYMLSVIYAIGIENAVEKDVNFAYECICKCAEIDPEYVEKELIKYKKGCLRK